MSEHPSDVGRIAMDRDPRLIAGIEMLRRTGMTVFRLGWSDEEDGPPTVWWACGEWSETKAEAGAGMDPVAAVLRLCEQVVDGGICLHCGKATIFSAGPDTAILELSGGCVYAWDPELGVFRRGCEGSDR